MTGHAPVGMVGLGLMGTALAELILDEGMRCGQELPTTSVQAGLLRKTIARLGDACDSAAVIEAIRPSRNSSAAVS
jgi:3-hydroxyisobutyrate dehydrogenase-like beta-hydroxyacid dehydrogenase